MFKEFPFSILGVNVDYFLSTLWIRTFMHAWPSPIPDLHLTFGRTGQPQSDQILSSHSKKALPDLFQYDTTAQREKRRTRLRSSDECWLIQTIELRKIRKQGKIISSWGCPSEPRKKPSRLVIRSLCLPRRVWRKGRRDLPCSVTSGDSACLHRGGADLRSGGWTRPVSNLYHPGGRGKGSGTGPDRPFTTWGNANVLPRDKDSILGILKQWKENMIRYPCEGKIWRENSVLSQRNVLVSVWGCLILLIRSLT